MMKIRNSAWLLLLWGNLLVANAFAPTSLTQHRRQGHLPTPITTTTSTTCPNTNSVAGTKSGSSTQLYNFMGSDGGILGVGTPELFTILLVGYFVLGPSDLYKVVKEIGKFVTNVQSFAKEASTSIETNLESQLQVEEIRKAQRELNDAFNFRRSINVDAESDAFEVNVQSERVGVKQGEGPAPVAVGAEAAAATATAPAAESGGTKKKIRRRRRKKVAAPVVEEEPVFNLQDTEQTPLANNVPDLEMADAEADAMKAMQEANEQLRREMQDEEAAQRRKERIERLEGGGSSSGTSPEEEAMVAKEIATDAGYDTSLMSPSDEQSRFQAQMSSTWNDSIVAKEEELAPLAKLMEQIALLEEEKNANDARLQEEFRLREENEERFYREKRQLLEAAAAQVQADAYVGDAAKQSEKATTK